MRKVVAIIDNGLPYDDHAFHFVTLDADKVEQLKILIDISDSYNSYATVIGVADGVKWAVKAPAILLEDYARPHNFSEVTQEQWHKLDKRFRRWLLKRWARVSTQSTRDNILRLNGMK